MGLPYLKDVKMITIIRNFGLVVLFVAYGSSLFSQSCCFDTDGYPFGIDQSHLNHSTGIWKSAAGSVIDLITASNSLNGACDPPGPLDWDCILDIPFYAACLPYGYIKDNFKPGAIFTVTFIGLCGSSNPDISFSSETIEISVSESGCCFFAKISRELPPIGVCGSSWDRLKQYEERVYVWEKSEISPSSCNQISSCVHAEASASPEVITECGTEVLLIGEGSTPDDATFQWSLDKPVNSSASIAQPSEKNTSFVADKSGTYKIKLVVSKGGESDVADVEVKNNCAKLIVNKPEICPGEELAISGVNFVAGKLYRLVLEPDGVELAQIQADSDGNFPITTITSDQVEGYPTGVKWVWALKTDEAQLADAIVKVSLGPTDYFLKCIFIGPAATVESPIIPKGSLLMYDSESNLIGGPWDVVSGKEGEVINEEYIRNNPNFMCWKDLGPIPSGLWRVLSPKTLTCEHESESDRWYPLCPSLLDDEMCNTRNKIYIHGCGVTTGCIAFCGNDNSGRDQFFKLMDDRKCSLDEGKISLKVEYASFGLLAGVPMPGFMNNNLELQIHSPVYMEFINEEGHRFAIDPTTNDYICDIDGAEYSSVNDSPQYLKLTTYGDCVDKLIIHPKDFGGGYEITLRYTIESGQIIESISGIVHNGKQRVYTIIRSLSEININEAHYLFRRSDSNNDGSIDISDAVNTLSFLFLGSGTMPCPDAADANDDGAVDISDAVYILSFLFLGGKDIPAPYPACGTDPTDDSLPDCQYDPATCK